MPSLPIEEAAASARDVRARVSCRVVAWASWGFAFAVPTALVVRGVVHAIPYGVYRAAGAHWLRHESLYDLSHIDGFQYLPSSAFLFAPLPWLGSPWGEVAWRVLSWSLYALGMQRLLTRLEPERSDSAFLLASWAAIGPAITNLFNGQANLLLAALLLHATVDLSVRHYGRAGLALAFGLACKPLMAVSLMLLCACYPALLTSVVSTLVALACAIWLASDTAYLLAQCSDALRKLALCADPDRLFEDVRGLLATLGVALSSPAYLIVRAVAAVFVWVTALRLRLAEPGRVFVIAALASGYLMLFNPRTLSSSYVLPGSFAAACLARALLARRPTHAATWLVLIVAWSVNHHFVPWVEHWLRPLACIGFMALLLREARSARGAQSPRPGSTRVCS